MVDLDRTVTITLREYHGLKCDQAYADMVEPVISSLPTGLSDLTGDDDAYDDWLAMSDVKAWVESLEEEGVVIND